MGINKICPKILPFVKIRNLPLSVYCLFAAGDISEVSMPFWRVLGGGRWDFRFCGFGHFLDRFFGFCTEKHLFLGFGVCCGLRFFHCLAFGFRFSAKIQAVFRIGYPMWFSVFPIWFPVNAPQPRRWSRVSDKAWDFDLALKSTKFTAANGRSSRSNPPYRKRLRLYILPQLLANLTQSIGTHRKPYFAKFFPELTTLCMQVLKFSDSFVCVFLSGFRISCAKNYG